ncbi:hypothetical protein QBC33DRAFT_47852 [Phialemonium atrogriseum]|uniref:Uncharacterized protein n=1 Tax=Phialemonium atrogriseum TaxID=1093897 RepID=A0AAJ0C145_9PEZI|nr:uncharacterized protein QBC33DRAFT_47852 [Phialemonium atrogriseum]KAK1768218.1 hypothetical protein QBC33DRAFT_47852 [Phialemonium atrogriseum]
MGRRIRATRPLYCSPTWFLSRSIPYCDHSGCWTALSHRWNWRLFCLVFPRCIRLVKVRWSNHHREQKQHQGKRRSISLETTASHLIPPRPKTDKATTRRTATLRQIPISKKKRKKNSAHWSFLFLILLWFLSFGCFGEISVLTDTFTGVWEKQEGNWIHTPQTGTRTSSAGRKRMEKRTDTTGWRDLSPFAAVHRISCAHTHTVFLCQAEKRYGGCIHSPKGW